MLRASSLFLAAFAALAACAPLTVRELDGTGFSAAVNDAEIDTLVLFVTTSAPASRAASATMIDALAARLPDSSTKVFSYDVMLHGWPAGLHTHATEDAELILFPAGGREPSRYEFAHDPLSATPGGGGGGGGAAADGPEGHAHASRPSVIGALRWLRTASSFPATVPEVALAEVYAGREGELFRANAAGLEIIKARLEALVAENAALRRDVAACREGGGGGAGSEL